MATNRRNFPRFDKRLRARFLDNNTWRMCFTADISVSGVYFESVWIPKAPRIEVEINVPVASPTGKDKEAPVALVGQLVRGARVPPQLLKVAKGGFAVKFLQAPPEWYEYCLALEKK